MFLVFKEVKSVSYFTYFLGLCAVFLSLFGYMTFFHEKLKISPSFTPILSVSTVAVFLYLLGFTGFLSASSTLLYVVGIALLVRTAILSLRKLYDPLPFLLSPGIIAFLIISLFFILRTRGMSVLHVDNFSHWATAVKNMCLTDAYPKLSGAVTFRNYPPGATVFIYHVCRAVSFTESHGIMAQGIMIAACAAPLFCKVSLKKPLSFLAIMTVFASTIVSFSLEGASLSIYNLTVDGLIAYVAAATGVIAYAYRRDLLRSAVILVPLTVWLSLIKSSGKIFSLFLIIFVFALSFRKFFRKSSLKSKLLLSAVCSGTLAFNLILPWFWDLYADIVFKGYRNKFSSGLGVLTKLTSKESSYLKSIFDNMMTELRDISSPSSKLLAVSLVIGLVSLLLSIIFKSRTKFMFCVCLISVSVLVFYIAELFVLYGFIFPEAEAVILASFYRYFGTVSVLISTVLLTASVYAAEAFVPIKSKASLSLVITSALILLIATSSLVSVKNNLKLLKEPYSDELTMTALEKREYFRDFYSSVSETVPPDSFVIVYTEKTDFFTSTLPQYELRTTHCMFIYPYMAAFEEIVSPRLEYPEYFVVESGLDSFKTLVTSHGYTAIGDGPVYEVNRNTLTLTTK